MKALFIGNSHTFYNDMPKTFSNLYEERQKDKMETVMLCHPAVDLEWHVKSFFDVRYNLIYGSYDYCFVQQQAHPFPGKNITKESIMKLYEFCKLSHTKLVVTETWAKKDRPEDQKLMIEAFHQFDHIEGIIVSPVGEIWMKVKELCPDIELYASDGAHASAYGDYLVACVHYAVITGLRTAGLSNNAIDFLQGSVKCPDNSGVINDKARLMIHLDEGKCNIIHKLIDEYLF